MPSRLSQRETDAAIRFLGINARRGAMLGILDHARNVRYEFHRHRRHQLIFPSAGLLFVETAHALYPCAPQRGLWIPAGTRHATTTGQHPTISVFFSPSVFPSPHRQAELVKITPLLREAANRVGNTVTEPADFIAALSRVIYVELSANLCDSSWPSLPAVRSPHLQKAASVAFENLEPITVAQIAAKSGQSERAMRRRFAQELGMGPELFLTRARLIRSMHLLVERPGSTITEIALESGYSSHSAFSSAFRNFLGTTPNAFRKKFFTTS